MAYPAVAARRAGAAAGRTPSAGAGRPAPARRRGAARARPRPRRSPASRPRPRAAPPSAGPHVAHVTRNGPRRPTPDESNHFGGSEDVLDTGGALPSRLLGVASVLSLVRLA